MRCIFSINSFSLISFYLLSIQFNFAASNSIYLPSPANIEIENFFKNGKLSKALNNSFCNNVNKNDQSLTTLGFKAVCVTFDSCSANSVFKDVGEFKDVVFKTMMCVENCSLSYIKNETKTNNVIESIYNSAIYLNATHNQLLVFTALALHNMYSFFKFTECNKKLAIGEISRGLLQLTSLKYYDFITNISNTNYIKYPYLLDEFSYKSILDEFTLFLMKFSTKNSCQKLPSQLYIQSLIKLNPEELQLISASFIDVGCNSLENMNSNDVKIYLQRLLRRHKIFQTLLSITERNKKVCEPFPSQFSKGNL